MKRCVTELFDFFQAAHPFSPGDPNWDEAFCYKLIAAASAKEASIWTLEKDHRLHLQYGTNVHPEHLGDFSLALGEGITGAVAQTRKTLRVEDAWSDQQHNRDVDNQINFRTKSMISAPMVYNDALIGVLNILNHTSGGDFPEEWESLLTSLGIMIAMARLQGKDGSKPSRFIASQVNTASDKTTIIGISRCIQDTLNLAVRAGKSKVPVMIYGESGTGKELAARKIHENTTFRNGPFLSINCAALSETILESELFGHVKGAFSGAVTERKGKFVAASDGTLFLDEIGDMSLTCQAKILRCLQESKVIPVGSDHEVTYDARIIAATNKPLHELVAQGKFREDLYYRLCGLEIYIPQLRQRRSDIPLLADYFIKKGMRNMYSGNPRNAIPIISEDAFDMLQAYSWPGNVRQLEQAIMAALAVCDNYVITTADWPNWLTQALTQEKSQLTSIQGKRKVVSADSEAQRLLQALYATRYEGTNRWNVAAAARVLSMPRKTLVYRIKKMNLTPS